MSFVSEFKDFATKGNLMDMAVGIIIGAAVGKMVGSLVENIIMPIVGVFMGGVNFEDLSYKIGDASIGYGSFIQAILDFLIIAFVIFMIIKMIANLKRKQEQEPEEVPEDVALLTEIRDLLKQRV